MRPGEPRLERSVGARTCLYLGSVADTPIEIYSDAWVASRRHELDSPVALTAPDVRGTALIRLRN